MCEGNIHMTELGQIEKRILLLLQMDGRMPLSEIARRAEVSEPTVRKKMAAMTESGLLKVAAIVDPACLGYEAAAIIGIDVDRPRIAEVAQKLASYPFVDSVSVTTGPWDIMIRAFFETVRDLHDFVFVELGAVEGIRDSQSHLVMRSYKFEGLRGVAGMAETPPFPATD
ncbi:Lrp/AsnC family transcriptional regulator [Sinirhodobacter populi]|uniref:Lrp/AsnC family transcriptional regulator n=2 Tax=Paenirhodobacter populi TaxID=2306993 RepID=A0A443IMC3_9RHOB|nr:Lrp/AsnC family transcriptional regulator [Sinirhodobacter populi]